MTVARRVAAVEAELDPTARVLRWLSEAHQYDSFERYFQATLSAGGEMPLDRLVREASAAAGQRAAGDRRSEDGQATIRETVVRFFLVMRINEVAAQTLEREALLQWALSASLLLASERGDRASGRRIPGEQLRDLALSRVGEMHALQDARRAVEGRFLGAAEALFPAASREWQEQLAQTDRLARIAVQQVELDGGPAIDGDAPLVPDRRTDRCIADLLEPARAKALDLMGDGEEAMGRMRRWLIA